VPEFLAMVHPEDRELVSRIVARHRETGVYDDFEHRLVRPSGEVRQVISRGTPIHDEGGSAIGFLGGVFDITAHKRLEAQLHQAQKMEAVGRLAGGVAHDFNNILTAIQGQGELLESLLVSGTPEQHHLAQMLRAAERGANLTRQLLAFSRKQVLKQQVLDLNQVVRGLLPMLQRLIGEDIQLMTALAPALPAISGDPGQLEQVILNLAVNARDAMAIGGELTLTTRRDEDSVVLEVRDTGCGMDEETRARLFEPFFTTKPRGKGTGLGLATVYGIVTQSKGEVSVASQPGRGSLFTVKLPAVAGTPDEARPPAPQVLERGTETLLVVEDDVQVRRFLQEVLERQGYRVLAARDGAQALELAHGGAGVQLVISDVMMPRMSGVELAQKLRAALTPPPRILYITGHPGDLEMDQPLLMKPFSVGELVRKIRHLLDY
jgi:signal transduction histidine kinase